MKIKLFARLISPLILLVAFSCRDGDVTAPIARTVPVNPKLAVDAGGAVASPEVSAGGFHSCAVDDLGTLTCWGRDHLGQTTLPSDIGTVTDVSTGYFHTCAVQTTGAVRCWGDNNFGESTVPGTLTPVSQLATGPYHTCALQTDGTVACWGQNEPETVVPTGLNSVTQISVGTYHSCALRTNASLVCWGSFAAPPADLPAVSQVSVGERFTCVLTTAGEVRCWGFNGVGQTDVPIDLGSALQVAAGYYHACALKTDHTVACWGTNDAGQLNLPSGLASVVSLSAGTYHTCAVRSDGSAVCWGSDNYGQSTAPPGLNLTPVATQSITFTSVPPAPAIVGGSYAVAATGGNSGNAVTFTVPATTDVCSVSGNTVALLSIGTCAIAADQAGAPGYFAAPQKTQSFEVQANQSVHFTSAPPQPAVIGMTYTMNTEETGAPGNAVTFSSLSGDVCTVTGNTATLVGAGTCTVAVDKAAGMGYVAAPQETQSFSVIEPQTQTISFTSLPPEPALVGGQYVVRASGGASNNVIRFNTLTPNVCLVDGTEATFIKIGTCHITADQDGNAYYLPAGEQEQVFDINDVQAIRFTWSPPNPAVVGDNYTVTATGGLSGNAVTFTSLSASVCDFDRGLLNLRSSGTCTIAANQLEGRGYLAAPQQILSFNVNERQIINFTSTPPEPALVGGSYSVSTSGGGSGNAVVLGSLTSSVCSVSGTTVNLRARGLCQLTADQAGNVYYLPAVQQQQSFDVYDVQTIAFTSTPPTQAVVGGATYMVSATGGGSGNPVTFRSLSTSVCAVSGSTTSFVAAGTCMVAADQAAGDHYLAAQRQIQSFAVINPIPQLITFTSTPPKPPIVGGAYTIGATGGGSGNAVVFTSLTNSTCSLNGTMVSFNASGTCTIAANQAGNTVYLTATQVTQSFVIDTRPIANAGSAQSGDEGVAVTFNASASSDADGDAVTNYNWNFGDGTAQNSTSSTVQHVYNDNGSYTVTLMVTDAAGATSAPATTSATIRNVAPRATFTPASPTPEGTMTLSLNNIQDAAGDIGTLQYAFDCGDGTGFGAFGSSRSFACYATDNGTRTVRAQVKDKDGGSNTYTATISVVNVAPTITMVTAPTTGSVGVDFTIQYRFSDPGTRDSPWWYQTLWGDGKKTAVNAATTQTNLISQTYRFNAPGTYTVTVRVSDKDSGIGTASWQVTIR